jgi:DNA-binding transcriptional regulator YhcF (GntR family)
MTNTKLAHEQAIVQAIQEWYTTHTYGPSFRNLADMTNISLGTVYSVCQELREVGIVEFQDGVARTMKIKGKQ